MRDGKVGTEADCCCGQCPCYKIDYQWTIADCGGSPRVYSGSVLFRESGIACYDDPDVVAVVIGGDGNLSSLSFGEDCTGTAGLDVSLDFLCDGTVVLDVPGLFTDVLQTNQAICCGVAAGTFTEDFFGDQQITVTFTSLGDGPCDCSGYTPVPP